MASEDYCHDLTVVQNLRNDIKHTESELASWKPDINVNINILS